MSWSRARLGFAFAIACGCSERAQSSGVPPTPPPKDGTETGLLGDGSPLPGSFAPGATPLRRLTFSQYRNTVADLLGPSITLPDDLETDTEVDGFVSLGATRTVPSAHGVEQYAAAAYALAHQALAEAGSRAAFVGCAASSADDRACASDFIFRFGRRAFRRPLTKEEIDRYTALHAAAALVTSDFYASLEYVVAAMLQSPNFLYRAEIGVIDPHDETRRTLDSFELASRLSYFLWNTMPDDELSEEAEQGHLLAAEGLERQAERLFASPRALDAQNQFFSEVFELGRLDNLPQLPAYFPQMTPTFGASAREETLALVRDVVSSRDASWGELFDSKRGFLNAEMAALYGAEAASATTPVELGPERAGILSRAAFLASNGHASSTSPTKRGKFVREVLLCQTVAPPPPNANVALRTDTVSPVPLTLRERLESHTGNPFCASCHTALDPVGLGVEEFDGIGAFRTMEAGRSIDNAGRLDGTPFAGAAELGALVKKDPGLGPCLVRGVFRYAVGHLETAGEIPVLAALSENFAAQGERVRSLMITSVKSASFRYAGEPQ